MRREINSDSELASCQNQWKKLNWIEKTSVLFLKLDDLRGFSYLKKDYIAYIQK